MTNRGGWGASPFVVARVAVLAALLTACGEDGAPLGDAAVTEPPTITGVAVTTPEDTALTFTIPATAPGGGPLSLVVSTPAHGTLAVTGQAVTYTPAPDFHGAEALTATVTADGASATAAIAITVAPVNDAPVAVDDLRAGIAEDVVQTFAPSMLLGNDTDVDGDALALTAVGDAVGGAVVLDGAQVVFTPAQSFGGVASFRYTVSDGAATATGTVTLTGDSDDDPPIAGADAVTGTEDTPLTIPASALLANDADPEGQALSLTAVAGATLGTVALAGGTVTFSPAANANGAAGFTYTLSDGTATATGAVTVTLAAVNDAPVAVDDAITPALVVGEARTLALGALLANDGDVDGDALAITSVQGGSGVTATLTATGVDVIATAAGAVAFTYTVSDGQGGADTATVQGTAQPAPCSNGALDPGETCDDGNTTSGDGCSSACQEETCGDGVINGRRVAPASGRLRVRGPGALAAGIRIGNVTQIFQADAGPGCDEARWFTLSPEFLAELRHGPNTGQVGAQGAAEVRLVLGEGAQAQDIPLLGAATGCVELPATTATVTFTASLPTVLETCDAGGANSYQPNAACRPSCEPSTCGDLVCDTLTEDPATCRQDCLLDGTGACDEDGLCERFERVQGCLSDCAPCDGNGTCEKHEVGLCLDECPADGCQDDGTCAPGEGPSCGDCIDPCDGDGTCELLEGASCADCTPTCNNDTFCQLYESPQSCPLDCLACDLNTLCEPFEEATCLDCVDLTCNRDAVCNNQETVASCPWDCGACGDGACSPEIDDLATCGDCAACDDGVCSPGETPETCVECRCGDGECEAGVEDSWSCNADCGFCGDQVCAPGESGAECYECAVCGDGVCHAAFEDLFGCADDCAVCGDEYCSPGESGATCPECVLCGDGACDAPETYLSCDRDCGTCNTDGICDPTEWLESCAADCATCEVDGQCGPTELPSSCPDDCPVCNIDGICQWYERGQCLQDCGP